MNERTYIIVVCFTEPIHLVCEADAKHMFCYLDFRSYFEANGQSHIQFWLIQVLKNSMT